MRTAGCRLVARTGVLAAAGMVAAACGSGGTSSPAASPAPSTRSGTQSFSGTFTGHDLLAGARSFRLNLSGVVNTSATISLTHGNPHPGEIRTGQGILALTLAPAGTSQKVTSGKTCELVRGQNYHYTVDGGRSTGTFKNATGSGTVTGTYRVSLPKSSSGACEPQAMPEVSTARLSITAHGPLTVRK